MGLEELLEKREIDRKKEDYCPSLDQFMPLPIQKLVLSDGSGYKSEVKPICFKTKRPMKREFPLLMFFEEILITPTAYSQTSYELIDYPKQGEFIVKMDGNFGTMTVFEELFLARKGYSWLLEY